MGLCIGDVSLEVVLLNEGRRDTSSELVVGDTLEDLDGVLTLLASVDVDGLVPVGLGDTGDSHKTVLAAANG